MQPRDEAAADPRILHLLQPGERIALELVTTEVELRVTDRRLLATSGGMVRLDVPYDGVRRIEFDIEAERPAVMVIVPQRPSDSPQVLGIPRERLHVVAEIIAFVGERLR